MSTSASLAMLKPLIVWITTNWKILKEMGIPDHHTCLLRNLYAGQEAVRTVHGTMAWFKIGKVKWLSCVQLFATPWTVACQASLSMEFSRQEYWSGLPFTSPGDLPNPGIQVGLLHCRQILYHLSHQGNTSFLRPSHKSPNKIPNPVINPF